VTTAAYPFARSTKSPSLAAATVMAALAVVSHIIWLLERVVRLVLAVLAVPVWARRM